MEKSGDGGHKLGKILEKNGENHDTMGVRGGQKLAETHLRGATVFFCQFMSKM